MIKQNYKVYNVWLETHAGGIRRYPRRVVARNISEAWDEANVVGGDFNRHNNPPCVVHSIFVDSQVNEPHQYQIIGNDFIKAGTK